MFLQRTQSSGTPETPAQPAATRGTGGRAGTGSHDAGGSAAGELLGRRAPGLLRRRHDRSADRRSGPGRESACDLADLGHAVPPDAEADATDRAGAGRPDDRRGIGPAIGRSHSRDGAADRRKHGSPSLGPQLRAHAARRARAARAGRVGNRKRGPRRVDADPAGPAVAAEADRPGRLRSLSARPARLEPADQRRAQGGSHLL